MLVGCQKAIEARVYLSCYQVCVRNIRQQPFQAHYSCVTCATLVCKMIDMMNGQDLLAGAAESLAPGLRC